MELQDTAGYLKTVPLVYNLLMKTSYLSHCTQVAEGTVFRKHTLRVFIACIPPPSYYKKRVNPNFLFTGLVERFPSEM